MDTVLIGFAVAIIAVLFVPALFRYVSDNEKCLRVYGYKNRRGFLSYLG